MDTLQMKIRNEKQWNVQMMLNTDLRKLRKELEEIEFYIIKAAVNAAAEDICRWLGGIVCIYVLIR